MLRSAENCKKCICFIYFFHSNCITFISGFENTQNSFSSASLCSILVCKIHTSFDQTLPTWIAHHTFLESRHPKVTKNLYYVLSTHHSQISFFLGSSSWTINIGRTVTSLTRQTYSTTDNFEP